jgi:hypothetical protein
MNQSESDHLVRRLISGDAPATAEIVKRAETSAEPVVLVAAALVDPGSADLLVRAADTAMTTRDRQLVAIAATYQAGEIDRVDALIREHLADFPDSLLVAWLAASLRARLSVPATRDRSRQGDQL